jgi:hypothetical protein
MRRLGLRLWPLLCLILFQPSVLAGQESSPAVDTTSDAADRSASSADPAPELPEIDGPPAPAASEMIRRDDSGDATVRATRIDRPIELDGRLDDEVYELVPPFGGFVQQVPREGGTGHEETQVWIFFDDGNLYIAARCLDSDPERAVANELRRDHTNITQGENFTVVIDTFYDRRNAYFFQTNLLGAIRDQLVANGGFNVDWNTVWDVRTARFDQGWTVEMVIPFKSLRYRRPGPQVWGLNLRRIVKWKNEISFLTPVPAVYGQSGIAQMGFAGTVVGIETPPAALNMELKPYAVSLLTTDLTGSNPFRNDWSRNVGFDFKYGLTSGLTADVTVNTDFAQVEEDLQQINLTRFNIQFPEKRDFFLEGRGIFAFGSGTAAPSIFFSRRIGLSGGESVPVIAGGRVTGKVGAYDVGLLNMQTAEKESADAVSTNFSVVRIKRDILRRSSIGILATERVSAGVDNRFTGGVDANVRLSDELSISSYYARVSNRGATGDESSYAGSLDYSSDRYGLSLEHIMIGDDFDPAVGFVRRPDQRRNHAQGRISRRLRTSELVRRLSWTSTFERITNAKATRVENRTVSGNFDVEFNNGDSSGLDYSHDYELLPDEFTISPGVVVPAGSYRTDMVRGSYSLGQQRKVSGNLSTSVSSFYGGTRTQASYGGRVSFPPRFSLEPSLSLNWVNLPYGDFATRLFSTRFNVTPSPRLLVSALVQINTSSHTVSSSARLRWEYVPGSELFVVYSDGRNTLPPGAQLLNRSIAIKITRLVRF